MYQSSHRDQVEAVRWSECLAQLPSQHALLARFLGISLHWGELAAQGWTYMISRG
jgi:hypothetical protein